MSFAKNLKKAMNERQMTQAELAARIGKGKSSVSQYLSGKNIPKDDVQKQIAEVLNCTVDSLNSDVPEGDHSEMDTKNISVSECAKILGKSEQFVRVGLQQGVLPFGVAVRMSSKYSYHVSKAKMYEYLGMKMSGEHA